MAQERLYRRTQAGTLAWQRQEAHVPLELRRVLGLIEGEMHPDTLRAQLVRFTADEILEILDFLAERGLLETLDAKEGNDLDFTSDLSFTDLRKAAG